MSGIRGRLIDSGPSIALLVEKLDAFEEVAHIVGNEIPSLAKIEAPER